MTKGQSLIELLITIALSAIFLPALLTGLVASREGKAQQNQRIDAVTYLTEGQEAVRSIREKGWNSFAVNGTYHPITSGSTWTLEAGSETINGLTRQIVISDIYRNSNGAIVENGDTLDPSTKKVIVSVSWNTPLASSIESTTYLSRYLNNSTFFQTTYDNFYIGSNTQNGTIVTNYDGGEVMLGAGGYGNWCDPKLTISAVDLPKSGVANAIWAVPGQVIAGTGDNASGISFGHVSLTSPTYPTPPVGTLDGTFDGYKTNAVFIDPLESNFAYIATDNNAKEVVILDLNQKDANVKYKEVGYFNAPGNGTGNSVFVSGSVGYLTDNNRLYTFDLSSKTGLRPQLNTLSPITLAGTGNKIVVNGSYLYVATQSTTAQLQIYQISPDGKTISQAGQTVNLNGGSGRDVFVNSTATRAYLVTSFISGKPEFFIIDLTNKSNPTLISSQSVYSTNGMDPKGVNIVPGNKAIIVGTGGIEYQVVDLTNEKPTSPATLSPCGPGLNIDSGINGISSVVTEHRAFSYIITGDASSELKIIEGGPGGEAASTGVFESATMAYPSVNNPQSITLNRFTATIAKPGTATDIQFQVAVAAEVNGSCSNAVFSYVGPDGTANSKFSSTSNSTVDGTFPQSISGNYLNPGYCFRYKAFLTTQDTYASPVLYEITSNFSP